MSAEPREKKILTLSEAHQILEKIDVEKADQIQKRTLDYTSKFSKITVESAKKVRKQLESDCDLSPEEAVEVINIMPKSIEELRTFTAGWRKLLPTETLEKMLKILKSAKEA
ncbi:MAG: RNA polymerase Rpb4 [Nitrososphaerales archaeon]|jgi:DNA-directed RNA polymerase subunit F